MLLNANSTANLMHGSDERRVVGFLTFACCVIYVRKTYRSWFVLRA